MIGNSSTGLAEEFVFSRFDNQKFGEENFEPAEYGFEDEGQSLTGKQRNKSEESTTMLAYLSEMKRYNRISPLRELILGKRIKKGQEVIVALAMSCPVECPEMKALKHEIICWIEKKRRPNLTENEAMIMILKKVEAMVSKDPENEVLRVLFRRLKRVDQKVWEAKEELITANLRLVINIAKNYTNRSLPFSDVIQEGNMGLVKAASKYDYTTGNRFSTYASWWIKQSITRAIYDKSRTIRLPVHFVEVRNKFFKVYHELFHRLQREPSRTEIAEAMDVSLEQVQKIMQLIHEPVSLETPLADEDSSLRDYIVDSDECSPYAAAKIKERRALVRQNLASLSPKEEKVMRHRFGIGVKEACSLEEVGRKFKISRERVRQIERRALDRLRHPARSQVLQNLL